MTLKELAKVYREDLKRDCSMQKINEIANRINNLTYRTTNKKLSKEDKEQLLNYIKNNNVGDNMILLEDSDNSAFLKAVAMLKAKVENGEGNK